MGIRREDGFGGQGDAVYEALLRAHLGLDDEASAALNTRLVLILANQVGDPAILAEAFAAARASLRNAESKPKQDGHASGPLPRRPDMV